MTDEQEQSLRKLIDQARKYPGRAEHEIQLAAELEWAIAEIRALEGKKDAPKIEGYK